MHLAPSMLTQKFILENSINIHNCFLNIFFTAYFFTVLWSYSKSICLSLIFMTLSYEINFLIFSRLMKSNFLWTLLWFSACSLPIHSHDTQHETISAKANPGCKSVTDKHWKWTDLTPVGCYLVSWLKSFALILTHRCLSV